jgi:hypothetical protein
VFARSTVRTTIPQSPSGVDAPDERSLSARAEWQLEADLRIVRRLHADHEVRLSDGDVTPRQKLDWVTRADR